jgi:hypothetical protein
MKYYKITLGRGAGGKLIYPANYQYEIGDHAKDHLYYSEGDAAFLLLAIPNSKTGIVRKNVVEISEAEAKKISEANEKREETVTSEATVRRLAIKAQLGQRLTAQELAALDPDKDEPGFGKVKIFADRIANLRNLA